MSARRSGAPWLWAIGLTLAGSGLVGLELAVRRPPNGPPIEAQPAFYAAAGLGVAAGLMILAEAVRFALGRRLRPEPTPEAAPSGEGGDAGDHA